MDLPEEPVLREVVERYARLTARLRDEIGERPMVLPDNEFFPDVFASDQEALEKLFRRMARHAGMSDVPIKIELIAREHDDATSHSGGCSSGACGLPAPGGESDTSRIVDEGDSWRVRIPIAELAHPVVLTANLARALGLIFLMETRVEDEPLEQPLDATIDLAAVALGFGALLTEGAYIYAKSCGGPRIASVTTLTLPEIAVAFALFAGLGEHSLGRARKLLDTTQRAVLGEVETWLESNRALVAALRDDPARVGRGDFKLDQARPWLSRVLGRKKAVPPPGSLEELEAAFAATPIARRAARPDPHRDELRDLVAEALEESRQA